MPELSPCPEDVPIRAAAVCYRRSPEGLEFLLVRTKYGEGWTFPKGQVEHGETRAEAAAREAREEAGASGRTHPIAVGIYRYRMGPGWEVCVESFLLEVDGLSGPDAAEGMRDPSWFEPEAAIAQLAIGREPRYVLEHKRVIEAAISALSR